MLKLFVIVLAAVFGQRSYFMSKNHYPNLKSSGESADIEFPAEFKDSVKFKFAQTYGFGSKRINFKFDTDNKYPKYSDKWYNSLAVCSDVREGQLHGNIGLDLNGNSVYTIKKDPGNVKDVEGGEEAACKIGGYWLAKSDSISLNRKTPEYHKEQCNAKKYDLYKLPEVSIIITYYNEPFSVLMRTVHSILNNTPKELLTEIILVDDGSNYNFTHYDKYSATTDLEYSILLKHYIEYLPKVKLLQMPERVGLVKARLAGIKAAKAPVITILDSHVEVGKNWLEDQLSVLVDNPNSLVVPQIYTIESVNFDYNEDAGIGCEVGFSWAMHEQSTIYAPKDFTKPIPTPAIAGGLFSIYKDYFYKMGAFDEDFNMWGSENIEISFRMWLCGGKILCAPCSHTFHIFRYKGSGYISPNTSSLQNKLRTAKLWTDQYYEIAKKFVTEENITLEKSLSSREQLKQELQCKPFDWYLENIAKNSEISPLLYNSFAYRITLSSIKTNGEIKNGIMCLDTMQRNKFGEKIDAFYCHGEGGTQNWLTIDIDGELHIVSSTSDRFCVSSNLEYVKCDIDAKEQKWILLEDQKKFKSVDKNLCLDISSDKRALSMVDCSTASSLTFKKA